jgi:hypothetical protein
MDSLQQIYLGSYDKGLVKKIGFNFYTYNTSNSGMPDDIVYSLAIERTGVIWAGTSAFGLVRIDENGSIGMPELFTPSPVTIYPNPVRQNLNVRVRQKEVVSYRITDLSGSIKIEKKNSGNEKNSFSIDVSFLAPGMYFLSVNTGEKNISKRFIKVD